MSRARRPGRSSRRTSPAQYLRTREDHAELHTPAPVTRAPAVALFAPPPEPITESAAKELQDLDGMSRELDVEGLEADDAGALDQTFGFVATQMAEPSVMAPVCSAEDGRDVA